MIEPYEPDVSVAMAYLQQFGYDTVSARREALDSYRSEGRIRTMFRSVDQQLKQWRKVKAKWKDIVQKRLEEGEDTCIRCRPSKTVKEDSSPTCHPAHQPPP